MAVCKHCGTEIKDGLEYCPNCGQKTEDFGDFFEPDEALEEEMYNIFDTPEEFDMDSLLSREFAQAETDRRSEVGDYSTYEEPVTIDSMEEISKAEEAGFEETIDFGAVEAAETVSETDDIAELLGLFSEEPKEAVAEEIEELLPETEGGMEIPVAEEADFFALDELFQDIDAEPLETVQKADTIDHGLEELLAVGAAEEKEEKEEKKSKSKKQKKEKEKKSFFKKLFGNVPVDPSKVKPEPTPEEIAAKKAKAAEEKSAKAEEKKLAAEEKKQIAQRNKEEKERQKALAKEEKKAKKLQEAKQILEEMQETRINRLGATIVFVFFTACAVALLFGSELFGYAISIESAEENFNKAYNNNVKYYTDAYNDIYGLDIKPEDQVLNDKIMTVMFVNKELNSYNSHMVLKDHQSALHSLLLGLYRYGKYYEQAIPLGIDRDMDYVRTQILKELEATFGVSEDEAELLRSLLEAAGAGGMNSAVDADAAREYNLALYEIVEESGLEE